MTIPSEPESRRPSIGGLFLFAEDMTQGTIGWDISMDFPVSESRTGLLVAGSRTMFLL
jgi:hypothetical protein